VNILKKVRVLSAWKIHDVMTCARLIVTKSVVCFLA
jgi:hypothetical protein